MLGFQSHFFPLTLVSRPLFGRYVPKNKRGYVGRKEDLVTRSPRTHRIRVVGYVLRKG